MNSFAWIWKLPRSQTTSACLTFALLLASSRLPAAENWPDFRGPTQDGHAHAESLPLKWSESENVAWQTAIPGLGWSTPVVWGDQIWMTTATDDGKKLWAVCVDRQSGKLERQILVFTIAEPEVINPLNSYASPSPVIDGERVYVHYGTYGTAAIDTKTGKIVWQRTDLKLDHKEGPGSSPVLDGPRLILTLDGMDVQYIIALDTRTGETVWKTDRSVDLESFQIDLRKAYSTPLLTEVDGQPQLICTAAQAAYGYDPRTGRELWRFGYNGFSNVARPVVGHGLMYLNTGYMKPQMLAVRLGGRGDITDTHLAWKYTQACPNKPSPVLVDDLLYMISDKGGVATCLDAKTGEAAWTQRIGGNYSASPLYADGRIYFFDQDGKTTVIKHGREFEELAVNELGDGYMASPAVAGNALLLRTKTHLYRVETPTAAGK